MRKRIGLPVILAIFVVSALAQNVGTVVPKLVAQAVVRESVGYIFSAGTTRDVTEFMSEHTLCGLLHVPLERE